MAVAIETRTDVAVVVTVALVLVDGLMTLPVWHLEGNPIVLGLGPWGMMATKIVASAAFFWAWFFQVRDSEYRYIAQVATGSLGLLYTLVVATNVVVLLTLG